MSRVCGNCKSTQGPFKYNPEAMAFLCSAPPGSDVKTVQAAIRACLQRRAKVEGE